MNVTVAYKPGDKQYESYVIIVTQDTELCIAF